MGFVISLLLIGIGAILTWAVTDNSDSINLDVVGIVLMGVGLVSFILTLFFWESWWGAGAARRTRYAEGDAYARRSWYAPRRRGYVVEEEDAPAAPPGPPPP
jgi:hypothetical protein